MKNKILKLAAIPAFMLIISAAAVIAQSAHDQYGFGNRVFVIQSALEAGKSTNGLWDIPGTPNKDDGNLRGTNWLHMGLWQREAGDPEDRVFRFRAAQGSAVGRYFISIGRSGNWGVNAIDGTGKIEARSRSDHFELKHMGNGRWKIYYKSGMIIAPASPTAKNGTKLVLLPDQNGPHTEWVFFDTATNQSFIPASTSASGGNYSYKGKLEDAIASRHVGSQYFQHAVAPQFNSENSGGKLQAYLNNMDKATEQWTAILNLVNAIKQNKDTEARRSMYQAISQANIKRGSGFAENLLKGQVQKQINDASAAERDTTAKGLLSQIAGKIQ
ncbi:MAG: hypothetical protein WDA74_02005 [Spirochaetota bacterium]